MGRYTGPKERLSRRAGVDLGLKGERALLGKSALERRGVLAPGQHGRRPRRLSVYGEQLLEKQKARWCYGLREKQFAGYAKKAIKKQEAGTVAGERLLALLEQRLDNVVYRLGLASTRAQARQFVSHGHIDVNGRRCNIPSAQVKADDTIAVRANAPVREKAAEALADVHRVPSWIEVDGDNLSGRVLRRPTLDEIDTPVNEQLIIEYYSR
jgi:small subunit ribosomal protein S4